MKNPFKKGDIKSYSRLVNKNDVAAFESGTVHDIYSTFALGRDAEWSGRLFVLEMKEEDEEGIGTFLQIEHKGAAKVGAEITFTASFEEIKENGEIINSFVAHDGQRLIAKGIQGQRILKKEKLEKILSAI